MATAHDVAAYILEKAGPMTAMKLQKLVYYSQAWHLVWEESPLFSERIEAWANGPVCPALYRDHRGRFQLADGDIEPSDNPLDEAETSTIDNVLAFYGSMSAHQLSELTHREAPWRDARKGMAEFDRGNAEITDAAMAEYYDSLTTAADA